MGHKKIEISDKYKKLESKLNELDSEKKKIEVELENEKKKIAVQLKTMKSEIRSGKKIHRVRGYNWWYIIKNFFRNLFANVWCNFF